MLLMSIFPAFPFCLKNDNESQFFHREFLLTKHRQASDADTARKLKDSFVQEFENRFPKVVQSLEEGFEDSIQYYNSELLDQRKISSTNTLERLNEEIRRRTKVVGIFPVIDSYIRLVTSYLIEYVEDKLCGASYIKAETLKQQKEILKSRKVA